MMRNFLSALLLLTWGVAHAEPHVIGYERFHSRAPSAQGPQLFFLSSAGPITTEVPKSLFSGKVLPSRICQLR